MCKILKVTTLVRRKSLFCCDCNFLKLNEILKGRTIDTVAIHILNLIFCF